MKVLSFTLAASVLFLSCSANASFLQSRLGEMAHDEDANLTWLTGENHAVDFGANNSVHSEMSNMFYNMLGNSAKHDINGVDLDCGYGLSTCLANTSSFSGFREARNGSFTHYALSPYRDRGFDRMHKLREIKDKHIDSNAWADHSGDVSAVPVPAAVWLFGSGLISLAGLARRKC